LLFLRHPSLLLIQINACAAILAHNHPSGVAEPSVADRAITRELIEALKLVSMAGHGLM